MKNLSVVIFVMVFVLGTYSQQKNYIKYVDPMIGTHKMGHTFPGATVPFGAVQLSPDTDQQPHNINGVYNKDTYKYCAGYQYDDTSIVGFSHTHFSGTGHSDLGDFLIMPMTGKLHLEPGSKEDTSTGFRSTFSHDNETAEAGYYKVLLEDYGIWAEMTASSRVGVHRYTFPRKEQAHIVLDLMHGIYNYDGKNVWTFARVEGDRRIVGYRQTNGWARTRTVYFAMEFSKPFKNYSFKKFSKEAYRGFWRKFNEEDNFPETAGKEIRGYFDFDVDAGEQIEIKFALSPVSTNGALQNLEAEARGKTFDQIKKEAQDVWNKELSRIEATTLDEGEMINFYTAMYHSMLSPTEYMDIDGQYKGIDQNVHNSLQKPALEQGRNAQHELIPFTNYTTFSLWDTYRALHPLLNLIHPKRNNDMIRSMQAHYDQSAHKMLPIWSHYANENWCMIGYHSVSVIADAVVKGEFTGDEAMKALEASVQTAKTKYYDGLEYYMRLGYVPDDKNSSAVSKTLEYAYDDWAIAQMAEKLGRKDIYDEFIKRSENWRNVYDASVGFMRPRLNDGSFRKDFDPLQTHGQGFIEGNAWNYGLYVPHNPEAMIEMKGGKAKFSAHLDQLFTMHLPDEFFAETEDVTREGIIGGYVHGNEPSHHVAYLYNWTDDPWKTQERVRMIMKNQYKPTPDGLGGNDDCGQMSAWYLFTALGFYPVAPGNDQYSFGSPVVKTAKINLENGKTFEIEARDQSNKNVYVTAITLNGKPLDRRYITHSEITAGGKLVYQMSPKPVK